MSLHTILTGLVWMEANGISFPVFISLWLLTALSSIQPHKIWEIRLTLLYYLYLQVQINSTPKQLGRNHQHTTFVRCLLIRQSDMEWMHSLGVKITCNGGFRLVGVQLKFLSSNSNELNFYHLLLTINYCLCLVITKSALWLRIVALIIIQNWPSLPLLTSELHFSSNAARHSAVHVEIKIIPDIIYVFHLLRNMDQVDFRGDLSCIVF